MRIYSFDLFFPLLYGQWICALYHRHLFIHSPQKKNVAVLAILTKTVFIIILFIPDSHGERRWKENISAISGSVARVGGLQVSIHTTFFQLVWSFPLRFIKWFCFSMHCGGKCTVSITLGYHSHCTGIAAMLYCFWQCEKIYTVYIVLY